MIIIRLIMRTAIIQLINKTINLLNDNVESLGLCQLIVPEQTYVFRPSVF